MKRELDIPIIRSALLTPTELVDVIEIIGNRLSSGCYYGPKEQYVKRLKRIIEKLPYLTRVLKHNHNMEGK
jgi:hypothetical protein